MIALYLCRLARLLAMRECYAKYADRRGCRVQMRDGWVEVRTDVLDKLIRWTVLDCCDLGCGKEAGELMGGRG